MVSSIDSSLLFMSSNIQCDSQGNALSENIKDLYCAAS